MIDLKLMLAKVISSSLIIINSTSIPILDRTGTNSGWRHNNKGTWYQKSDTYATGWENINNNYYYFYEENDSPKKINFQSVYNYSNEGPSGYMAHDTIIDGLYLNHNGYYSEGGPEIKAYIDLLNNRDWLKDNIYNFKEDTVLDSVYIIDIDKDGSCELLIYNRSLLYVITYNNGDIKKIYEIHAGDGDYYGYSPSQKMFFVSAGRMDHYHTDGYKIENNECIQAFSSTDDQKLKTDGNGKAVNDEKGEGVCMHKYTINGQNVSTSEYKAYFKKFNIIRNSLDDWYNDPLE